MSTASFTTEEPSATPAPALWPVVSSRDAGAVATRWRERPSAPRGVVVEREGAAESREALRVEVAEEPGCYKGVRAWTSRADFLAGLRLYLRHYPEALRGVNKNDVIAVDAFMRIMTITAEHAEPHTGRGVRAHKKTVARLAGCSEDHVQRAWRFAACRLDVLRDIRRARPLKFWSERWPVMTGPRMRNGSRCPQRGITPLRAFHVPAWLAPWIAMATAPVQRDEKAAESRPGRPVGTDATDPLQPAPGAGHSASAVGFASPPRRTRPDEEGDLSYGETCGQSSVSLRSTKRTRSARRPDEGGRPRARRPIRGERLALDIARMLGWSTSRHEPGTRVSPRRTAPALADFEAAGWTAAHWLATARAVADGIGYRWPTSSQQIHSPGGWIAWLTSHMIPDEPPAEAGSGPAAPPWLQPCGRTDCDGHGWLRTSDPVSTTTGQVTVAPCPDCPPRIRSATPEQIERRDFALATPPQAMVCVSCQRSGPTVVVRADSPLRSAVCDPCWHLAQHLDDG